MATIAEIMNTRLITIGPEAPLGEAIELLIQHRISGMPVVDAQGRILGVLSERDLLRAFYEEARCVRDLMTPEPVSIAVDAPLVEVFDTLMANTFRRVLIHERGKLVGLISRADLMPAVLDAIRDRAPAGG
ncbi:MAG: CBS domain-containing protein [Myxococcales bacterium]|nr:CBS domain-containing protein [Myxococcales bacterium]